jgi:D-alanine-D-alanine ligase
VSSIRERGGGRAVGEEPLRVGLTFDLRSTQPLAPGMPRDRFAELDDERTVADIEGALETLGHRVERIGGVRELVGRLSHGSMEVDVVFNLAEGIRGRGREAQVPTVLEAFGIAYTGSDPVTLAVTLDKALTKRVWREAGLPTAPFQVVAELADLELVPSEFPRFVKPVAEGSSMGVDGGSVVGDAAELRARVGHVWRTYGEAALVEPFLTGREHTVGVLDRDGVPEVLAVAETAPPGALRGYDEKRTTSAGDATAPFRPLADPRLERELGALALAAYRAVGCRDLARVDLRADAEGRPQLLEINALPGLAPDVSAMAFLARLAGRSYRSMIGAVLAGALRRRATQPQG